MKYLPALLLVTLMPAQRPPSATDATRKLLAGDHLLSLQWVSWDRFGRATVTDDGGKLSLKGEQRKDGDYVIVDGAITEVLPNGFRFHGKVTTRVSYINQGKPCVRDGDLTFIASGARKFWRMREMNNPCDEAADYVDVYFDQALMPADFAAVFAALKPIFAKHEKVLAVKAETPDDFIVHAKSPSPFPQHKGQSMYFGGVRLGKAYVSFHLMPLYMCPELNAQLSPGLKKRMQGKSCFNFKEVPDAEIMAELKRLVASAIKLWKEKKWL